jgi:SecD/SecF fusion protein
VALFLLVFYRVLGVIAVGALAVYAIFLFALIKLIPITLTLPGIAGLILTIGVAADANIVIFERVKEEIRSGRIGPGGHRAGYKRGLSAIIDANVVTFMVAFILFILATAGIKGLRVHAGRRHARLVLTAVLLTQAVARRDGPLALISAARARSAPASASAMDASTSWALEVVLLVSGVILLVCALAVGARG